MQVCILLDANYVLNIAMAECHISWKLCASAPKNYVLCFGFSLIFISLIFLSLKNKYVFPSFINFFMNKVNTCLFFIKNGGKTFLFFDFFEKQLCFLINGGKISLFF